MASRLAGGAVRSPSVTPRASRSLMVLSWSRRRLARNSRTAALAWDPWIARGARLWNDANVLALSLKRLAPDVAVEVVQAFLETAETDADEAGNIARLGEIEQRSRCNTAPAHRPGQLPRDRSQRRPKASFSPDNPTCKRLIKSRSVDGELAMAGPLPGRRG